VWDWNAAKGSSIPNQAYCEKFYNRTIDLITKYNPDLLYFDDTVLPLYPISDVGLRIAAYYYNLNMQRHDGKLEAVLTGKVLSPSQRQCMVWDIERGQANAIEPLPWQTDTCIGEWHYSRRIFDQHRYKTPAMVARMLVDIVSKNGNLLLNIPLPGPGQPDTDELAFLAEFTQWMDVNSVGIYGTRPWKVYGEGPSTEARNAAPMRAQGFNEGRTRPYTARDFRFMQKNGVLYAYTLEWPENGALTIVSLADGSPLAPGTVAGVELLGMSDPIPFTRDGAGLHLTLPAQKVGNYAYGFKISGEGLT
jgi:alpha-L-fucosidase